MPTIRAINAQIENLQAKIDTENTQAELEQNKANQAHGEGNISQAKGHDDMVRYHRQNIQRYQSEVNALNASREQTEAEIAALEAQRGDLMQRHQVEIESIDNHIRSLQG